MSATLQATLLRPEPGPDTLKTTRWGGHRLAALRGGEARAGQRIGESWELSTLPGRVSRARGRSLDEHLRAPLPFLAKLIDTALPLSVQVHPDDREGASGKEEAWMILDAEPDAQLWAGLADGVTREELLDAAARARANRASEPALFDLLQTHAALPGMIIVVPAGTVHAIGGGVLLAEIQQPSDCTYRIYDYRSGRQLHVEDASRTIRADARPVLWRPGDPPGRLRAKHLDLQVLLAGEHRLEDDVTPRLVAALRGNARIAGETLLAGELGLLLPSAGGLGIHLSVEPTEVAVDPGGIALVGRCS